MRIQFPDLEIAARSVWRSIHFLLLAGSLLAFCIDTASSPVNTQRTHLPETDEKIDAEISRIETLLPNIRARNLSVTAGLAGQERNAASEQRLNALDQHARLLRDLKEIRRAKAERRLESERAAEPATLATTELLHDRVSKSRLELQKARMFLRIVEGDIAASTVRLSEARRLLRETTSEPERDGSEARDLPVFLEARAAEEAEEATLETAEIGRLVAWESIESLEEELQTGQSRLASARVQSCITPSAVAQVIAQIEEKELVLRGELADAIGQDRQFRIGRTNSCPGGSPLDLELEREKLEASGRKVETYHGFLRLTSYARTIWADRLWAAAPRPLSELKLKRREYRRQLETLHQWNGLMEQSLSAISEQVLRQVLRSESVQLTERERQAAHSLRTLLQERALLELRVVGVLAFIEDLTARVEAELSEKIQTAGWSGKAQAFGSTTAAFVKRIWGTDLYIAEESVIAGGQKVSIPRSITLGKVVIALAIFLTGTLLAYFLRRALIKLTTWRSPVANTAIIGDTLGGLVALLSLVLAMASVRIPWSIFAFMGGALAIGVGFGAQALINNFISGAILLCERSIRLGDIVEVDNQRGKVMRVGFRNSLISRPDGVDVLVPNSQFLEKKVVNWTLTNDLTRQSVTVVVGYHSTVGKISELMQRAASDNPHVLDEPSPSALLEDFSERGMVFTLQFWTHLRPGVDGGRVRSQVREKICSLFGSNGVQFADSETKLKLSSLPFHVRTGQLVTDL